MSDEWVDVTDQWVDVSERYIAPVTAPEAPTAPVKQSGVIDSTVNKLENPENWKQLGAGALRGVGALIDALQMADPTRFADRIASAAIGEKPMSTVTEQAMPLVGEDVYNYGKDSSLGAVGQQIPGMLIGAPVAGAASALGAGFGREYGGATGEAIGSMAPVIAAPIVQRIAEALNWNGEQALKSAMNVQRSDLTKAAKFQPKGSAEDSPLITGLRTAQGKGILRGIFTDAPEFINRNEAEIDNLGDAASGYLRAADNAGVNVAPPMPTRATEYIAEHPYQREQLTQQLQNRLDTWQQEWDGTLEGLNTLKQRLYRIAYKGTTESQGLDKALASDLRAHIENEATRLLGGEAGERVAALNAEQGQHLAIRDLLFKNKQTEQMPQGLMLALRRLFVSPIGGAAALGGAGAYTGNPTLALAGALAGALSSRAGRLGISSASYGGGAAGEALAKALRDPGAILQALAVDQGREYQQGGQQ